MSAIAARGYALRSAARLIRRSPLTFAYSVTLAGLALALPLALVSLAAALAPTAAAIRPAPEVSIFIAQKASKSEVAALQKRLSAHSDVSAVRLIERDDAFAQLARAPEAAANRAESGLSPADNPLPDVLVARLTPGISPAGVKAIATDVASWPQVDTVRSDTDWYTKISAIVHAIGVAAAVFGMLAAGLVALAIVGSVQRQAASSAIEIELLLMAGATRSFIVRPYVYAAATVGVLAAMLAAVAVYAVHFSLAPPLAAVADHFGHPLALPPPPLVWVGAGVAVAAVGAALLASITTRWTLRLVDR